jgi:hypothetical protein
MVVLWNTAVDAPGRRIALSVPTSSLSAGVVRSLRFNTEGVLRINADGAVFDLDSGDGTARLVRVNRLPPEQYIFGLSRILSHAGEFAVVEHGRRGSSVNQPIRERLYVWSLAEGRVVATYPGSLSGPSGEVAAVAISPMGAASF